MISQLHELGLNYRFLGYKFMLIGPNQSVGYPKMEYISKQWSDLIQILNLRYGDQSNNLQKLQMKTTFIVRQPLKLDVDLHGRWP